MVRAGSLITCHYIQNKMSTKIKRLLAIGLCTLILTIVPIAAHAAAVGLPCTPTQGSGTANNTDLFTCVNSLYKYALVISSIAAVLMIIFAGYMYIFSGGSESKVSTAKAWIASSLLGIAVLLTGFLLLKQINPSLLTVKNISPQQIAQQDWFVAPIEDGHRLPPGGSTGPGGPVVGSCPGGQIVDIPRSEFEQYDNNKTCSVLLEALRQLKQLTTTTGLKFKVNDSFDLRPNGKPQHSSDCHEKYGTCVDIGLSGNTTWDALCKAVNDSGLFRILNESKQTSPNCGTNVNTALGTGPHLHLNLIQK